MLARFAVDRFEACAIKVSNFGLLPLESACGYWHVVARRVPNVENRRVLAIR
jgi:hypothetical protein